MKKIFSRFTQDTDEHPPGGSQHSASIGRNYRIGSVSLVIEDVIAEGGFGVVLRARSAQGQTYALKRTYVNDKQKLAVCKREITIVSSLSHKNIIRYVDSSIQKLNSGVFEVLLLTVFYAGNLSQLLNDRRQRNPRMTEAEVLRVLCDLTEAVSRLHHCYTPVIHRDLKIENILIDEHQNFVLCDFGSATSRVLHPGMHGIARCEEEISKYTTLSYRAPELVNLYLSIPLGPAIDIWAMGCILYCVCFGSLPFGESTLAIVAGNYTIPDGSSYSERVHKLIGYLLCTDAMKRPDIFQVSTLAFSLSHRENPVQNINQLPLPVWHDLPTPPRLSEHSRSGRSNTLVREPPTGYNPCGALQEIQSKAPDSPNSPQNSLAPPTTVARSRPRASSPGAGPNHTRMPALVPPPPAAGLQHHTYQRSDNRTNAVTHGNSAMASRFAQADASATTVFDLIDVPSAFTAPKGLNANGSTVGWQADFQQLSIDTHSPLSPRGADCIYPTQQHNDQLLFPTCTASHLMSPLSLMRGHHRGASDGSVSTLLPPIGHELPPRQVRSLAHLPAISDCPTAHSGAKDETAIGTPHVDQVAGTRVILASDEHDNHVVLPPPLHTYLNSPTELQCDDDSLYFGAAFDAIQNVRTTQAT